MYSWKLEGRWILQSGSVIVQGGPSGDYLTPSRDHLTPSQDHLTPCQLDVIGYSSQLHPTGNIVVLGDFFLINSVYLKDDCFPKFLSLDMFHLG